MILLDIKLRLRNRAVAVLGNTAIFTAAAVLKRCSIDLDLLISPWLRAHSSWYCFRQKDFSYGVTGQSHVFTKTLELQLPVTPTQRLQKRMKVQIRQQKLRKKIHRSLNAVFTFCTLIRYFLLYPGFNWIFNKNLLPYLPGTAIGVGVDFLGRVQLHVSPQLWMSCCSYNREWKGCLTIKNEVAGEGRTQLLTACHVDQSFQFIKSCYWLPQEVISFGSAVWNLLIQV